MKWRLAVTIVLAVALCGVPGSTTVKHRPVVVIGIDGMDPELLRGLVDRGRMPHFASLIRSGAFVPLETSVPPQSPVAWSNFITGTDPGGHGIFDFIHRDPATYLPRFSTAQVIEPEKTLRIGRWNLPLSSGKTRLLRKGEAFWEVLDRHGIPCTIMRIPANFPPVPSKGHTLSGMGTPDLIGGYGTFSFYTDNDSFAAGEVSGGVIHKVKLEGGQIRADLVGPENSLLVGRPPVRQPFQVDVDPEHDAARIALASTSFILVPGEWSDWVPVTFEVLGPLKQLSGICRFHLRSVRPFFELYVTPINLDPARPELPISTPARFSRQLSRRIGDFYTQGIAEDTKALENGVFDDAAFVSQSEIIMSERWRMLDAVLDEYAGGFLFFYVSTIDQSCHALWRNADRSHPAHAGSPGFADQIEKEYVAMDSLLGVVVDRIPKNATLIVMSDHGFAPYYKKFHLNSWLHQQGYLALTQPGAMGRPLLQDVFWRRTRAYGLGLNGLYLNVLDREGKGIVRRGESYDQLLAEVSGKLLTLRDPETGAAIITRVDRPADVYHGAEASNAPDLIIGYNRGYRCSNESALGTIGPAWLTPNLDKWSADHCMDYTLVPGVLLTNHALTGDHPSLLDLPVTILDLYGIPKRPTLRGRALIRP